MARDIPERGGHTATRNQLRVLAVSSYSETGGGEHLLVDLLAALRARGIDVELLVLGDGPVVGRAVSRSIRTTIGPSVSMRRPRTVLAGARAVRRAIARARPSVVHAANPKAQVVNHLATLGLGCARTIQLLDPPPPADPYARVTRHLDGLRFAITAPSAHAWSEVLGRRRVELVPPGIDASGLVARARRGDAERAWARAGVRPGNSPGVVMVSRLQRYKGVFDFVELAARTRAQCNARFLLVGPDERMEPGTRAALWSAIRARGLEGSVGVSEPLSEDDLAAVVAGATLAVHPAYTETFGLVVVEALALGTPVVAYAAEGPAVILATGGGTLVPVGDVAALAAVTVRALQDGDLRARWIDAGRRTAARFDLERAAAAYEAAFEGLLLTTR